MTTSKERELEAKVRRLESENRKLAYLLSVAEKERDTVISKLESYEKDASDLVSNLPPEVRAVLTVTEINLLITLYKATHYVSKEKLLIASRDITRKEEVDLKIVDVYIHHIRKKVKKLIGDIKTIETIWGLGYALYPEFRAVVKAWVTPAAEDRFRGVRNDGRESQ